MKISLHPHHQKHVESLGVPPPQELEVSPDDHADAMRQWEKTGFKGEELRMKVIGHLAWKQHSKVKPEPIKPAKSYFEWYLLTLGVIILIVLCVVPAHCQFSKISTITVTDGTNTDFTASPFKMSFSGCSVGGSGSAMTISCSGSAANPGGSADQLQYNDSGTSFNGIAFGTSGQILESCGTNCIPSFQDPVVSGPDAPGAASTKNPVQIAGNDGTDVRAIKTDSSGNVGVTGTFWQSTQPVSGTFWQTTQPVSGTFWQSTQPISAASLPLPSGAATAAKQPALGTAGTPSADVISVQGVSSMTALKVDGSGVTQPVSGTFWQSTQPVSGTVTATQATGSNLHIVCDSGCSSSTAPADEATFTEGTTSFSPFGGYFQTSPTSLTTGHMGAVGMTATRHLFVNIPDALPAGTNVIGHVIADSGSTTAVTGNVAVTKADGSDVTMGSKADAKSTATDTTAVTIMQVLKEISALEQAPASRAVTGTFWQATQPVSGTFWQSTQPVSIASMPSTPVTGTFWQTTQPVSGTVTANLGTTGDPCGPGQAKSYAFYDASTNGATQLVALSSGKIVYVCSYAITSSSTTANTIKLVYGTGSNCATGQTAITPGVIVEAGTSTGPAGKVVPNSAGLQTIASNELCVLTNAAQAAQVEVSYVQQ